MILKPKLLLPKNPGNFRRFCVAFRLAGLRARASRGIDFHAVLKNKTSDLLRIRGF